MSLLRRLEALADMAAQTALISRVAASWRNQPGPAGEAWEWLDWATTDFERAVEELDAAGSRAHAVMLLDVVSDWPA